MITCSIFIVSISERKRKVWEDVIRMDQIIEVNFSDSYLYTCVYMYGVLRGVAALEIAFFFLFFLIVDLQC